MQLFYYNLFLTLHYFLILLLHQFLFLSFLLIHNLLMVLFLHLTYLCLLLLFLYILLFCLLHLYFFYLTILFINIHLLFYLLKSNIKVFFNIGLGWKSQFIRNCYQNILLISNLIYIQRSIPRILKEMVFFQNKMNNMV